MATILATGASGLDQVNDTDNIKERAKLNETKAGMPLPNSSIKDGSLGAYLMPIQLMVTNPEAELENSTA